jgi:hypothetical protein
MFLRWAVIIDPLLGNGSVNAFPQQQVKRGVAYAIRAEEL